MLSNLSSRLKLLAEEQTRLRLTLESADERARQLEDVVGGGL